MEFKVHLHADHEQKILQNQMKPESEASYLINQRRSANYKPNIWKNDFLDQSLISKYDGDEYRKLSEKLIEEVKIYISAETKDLVAKLELIDSVRKLGLANHFEKEIKEALDSIAAIESDNLGTRDDLYGTALHFKILRQHGYKVSQDIFGRFMDEKGTLENHHFAHLKGMLELFEASNLGFEGEDILDEAKASLTLALRDSGHICYPDSNLSRDVIHSLELPSHRRVQWFDVKWQINAYEKDICRVNATLLELAKLNFNMVQAHLQKDLREASKWDSRETEQLPECMKMCFQVLYNTTCEIAHEIEKENGWNQVLPQLTKVWADFCKALLVEAEWYNKSHIPTLEEYLRNGCNSSSVSILLVHSFFFITHEGTKEMADFLHKNEDLLYNLSLIVRLNNDLGTSAAEQERGDSPSSIVCYMREVNTSEEIARKNIKGMIDNAWKKVNGKCFTTNQVPFLSSFMNNATNMARVAHSLYKDGDGFGDQEKGPRTHILSILFQPLVN
ncbi:(E,E)-alpha-farnesene synthase-like isoform X3 [Pyrus x bretschneideri]|uniref:(E,E)-alpha-farnesene synthase-like isoform X3 n=1 Tax=Pyrus x bretschneideri TaxID=225117 RepID=UPI00202F8F06|nr:(E,E)-alpha-farnesene synthase-like isoform X3 [Pyrus x bretschneideri]